MKPIVKPYYADALKFEVPIEDFLTERPKPWTKEELAAREIEPPDWALAATSKVGGRRHEKRRMQSTGKQFWGDDRDAAYSQLGPVPMSTTKDEVDAYNRALARRARRKGQGKNNEPSPKSQVPPGNLLNDDYRFWKGYVIPDGGKAQSAQCKWCDSICLDRKEMVNHHIKWNCKEMLLALYKYAKLGGGDKFCFVCKARTGHQAWGIPLCNTTSCLARWKFNFTQYLHGMVQYRQWAEDDQKLDSKHGPFSGIAHVTTHTTVEKTHNA